MDTPVTPPQVVETARVSLANRFSAEFGRKASLYRAPGRVNLIGEHTDYNDGFVLPAALEMSAWVAAAARSDRLLRVRSMQGGEVLAFDIDDPDPDPRHDWSDYVRGVAVMLKRDGHVLSGADLLIDSDVPIGSGLSSSAALEVSTGFALLDISGIVIDRTKLALCCQRAESDFVGMHCGIMDQFVSCHGASAHALFIDCRDLSFRPVPIASSVRLVICNSMVHHKLAAAGEYNLRRAECERGVALLTPLLPGIKALRDVSMAQLVVHEAAMPALTFRRCRHVLSEDDRVLRAAACLETGEVTEVGQLMNQSHRSLRDDYEVSCHELDLLVEIACGLPGVLGSRMTGGGFGGCTVSLVGADAVERVAAGLKAGYTATTGLVPEIFVCSPGNGVSAINMESSAQ